MAKDLNDQLREALVPYLESMTDENNPDRNNASYDAIRIAVEGYRNVNPGIIGNADFGLLLALTDGVEGGIGPKRQRDKLEKSHLGQPQQHLIDNLLDEVIKGTRKIGFFKIEYRNTGENNISSEVARQFIKMLVELSYLTDPNEILDTTEKGLSLPLTGIQTGRASDLLHCLFPNIFPIINDNENRGPILYQALGIPGKQWSDRTTYVNNTRLVLQYINENFQFKNLRVIDGAQYYDPEVKRICDLIKTEKNASMQNYWFVVSRGNTEDKRFSDLVIGEECAYSRLNSQTGKELEEASCYKMARIGDKVIGYDASDEKTKNARVVCLCEIPKTPDENNIFIKKIEEFSFCPNYTYLEEIPALINFQYFHTWGGDYRILKMTKEEFDCVVNIGRGEADKNGAEMNDGKRETALSSKNIILYGPPGTGKTYNTMAYALYITNQNKYASVDAVKELMTKEGGYEEASKEYRKLLREKRIAFTTFHQSYGYEEFIEGIRPNLEDSADEDSEAELTYHIESGAFKQFCDNIPASAKTRSRNITLLSDSNPNPKVWKVGLSCQEDPFFKKHCREEGCIRIGWDEFGPEEYAESNNLSSTNKNTILRFQDEMNIGDFTVTTDDNYVDIAIITGDFTWQDDLPYYKRSREVNWIARLDKKRFINELNMGIGITLKTVYSLWRISGKALVEYLQEEKPDLIEVDDDIPIEQNYVFIIDEINRGNISKIFGELITLIESRKRIGEPEELRAILPYSKHSFGIPKNLYIIGTMNTADRSIALMDTALRRRFDFVEMMPEPELLGSVEGIDLCALLTAMNKRIEVLYDREHTIGHSYFMHLGNSGPDDATVLDLANVFQKKVIPLLQEYFYEDYGKVGAVLGAAGKYFIIRNADQVFPNGVEFDIPEETRYEVVANDEFPIDPDIYRAIYDEQAPVKLEGQDSNQV